MKNFIFGLITNLILFTVIAITPVGQNVLTTKPLKPKIVTLYNGTNPEDFILNKTREGFIVQSTCHSSQYFDVLVIMVKY